MVLSIQLESESKTTLFGKEMGEVWAVLQGDEFLFFSHDSLTQYLNLDFLCKNKIPAARRDHISIHQHLNALGDLHHQFSVKSLPRLFVVDQGC